MNIRYFSFPSAGFSVPFMTAFETTRPSRSLPLYLVHVRALRSKSVKLIAHTFYATTRLRVLQIRPWPTSATIERRLWRRRRRGKRRVVGSIEEREREGEGQYTERETRTRRGRGDGRVVPVSNEDHDRSSDLRNDANNPRAKRQL